MPPHWPGWFSSHRPGRVSLTGTRRRAGGRERWGGGGGAEPPLWAVAGQVAAGVGWVGAWGLALARWDRPFLQALRRLAGRRDRHEEPQAQARAKAE